MMKATAGALSSFFVGTLLLVAGFRSSAFGLLIAGALVLVLALVLGIKAFGELDRLWSGE